MNARQDSVLSPSVHSTPAETFDQHAGCRGTGLIDEHFVQPSDAFGPEPEYTEAEEEEMRQQYLDRVAEDARRAAACAEAFRPLAEAAERVKRRLAPLGYVGVPCVGCGTGLFIRGGESAGMLCPSCLRAAGEVDDDEDDENEQQQVEQVVLEYDVAE